jgi:hypothetical protein
MDTSQEARRSHLFVLRVWRVVLDDGTKEWRGAIEYLASREKKYFREWSAVLDFMQQRCDQTEMQAARDDSFLLSQKKSDSE